MLLVDDNARYRHQLRRMIGKVCPHATIYEAEDIGEAIHLTQRVALQLALVDVVLGEEDGIRCTRRIKALSPTSRVVFVLLLIVGAILSLRTDTFLTANNLSNISRAFSWIAIAAFGESMVMIIGGVDLSVGAVMASSGS